MALEYLPMLSQSNIPDYATQEANRQLVALQSKRLQMELDKAEAADRKEQAFQGDLEGVLTNPSAEGYARLILKHPEYAEKTKAAWGLIDGAKQQSDLTQMGEIYTAAANGRYDLASASLKRRIEADKAADGQADPQDEAMLAALESGDPVQQKAAMGMIGLHLATITGPDKFSATLGALGQGGKEPTAFMQNYDFINSKDPTLGKAYLEGEANGRPVVGYDANGNPMAVNLGSLPKYQGGGGQASGGGGAPAPRRSMGWTPRARDGGNNSDQVVDNKLGVMAKRMGVGIDDELAAGQIPVVFDAIAATENTASALNNPGGIKDGTFAKSQPGYAGGRNGFATFSSPAAGRNAGINLLGTYWQRGQRSLRDIIEGKPVGGQEALSGLPRIRSQQEYAKLPAGAHYIAPDGSVRVKS